MKLHPGKCHLLVCGHKHECILLVCGHKHECILAVHYLVSLIKKNSWESLLMEISEITPRADVKMQDGNSMQFVSNAKFFLFIDVKLC